MCLLQWIPCFLAVCLLQFNDVHSLSMILCENRDTCLLKIPWIDISIVNWVYDKLCLSIYVGGLWNYVKMVVWCRKNIWGRRGLNKRSSVKLHSDSLTVNDYNGRETNHGPYMKSIHWQYHRPWFTPRVMKPFVNITLSKVLTYTDNHCFCISIHKKFSKLWYLPCPVRASVECTWCCKMLIFLYFYFCHLLILCPFSMIDWVMAF